MPYNETLAERVRQLLHASTTGRVEEKKVFRGLTFMVNDKMMISVSGERLMCRYDPALQAEVEEKDGYQPMIMKGREYKGCCYVEAPGIASDAALKYWIKLCLRFNDEARSSKKGKSDELRQKKK